jgi:hypothetical protein
MSRPIPPPATIRKWLKEEMLRSRGVKLCIELWPCLDLVDSVGMMRESCFS